MSKPFTPELISVDLLIRCSLSPTAARNFALPLQQVCERYQISTPQRFSAFMGQCMVESTNFTQLEENLYYTSVERVRTMFKSRITSDAMAQSMLRNPQALANRVYAGRGSNGDEASGEGWRYRGRGVIQLTLKENYSLAAYHTGRPYMEQPDLVAQPLDAALTAAWYWQHFGCNALSDAWEIDRITRVVNGSGMHHRLQRRSGSDAVLRVLLGED